MQIDKASMLDEAIEYLKTLQLQVQVPPNSKCSMILSDKCKYRCTDKMCPLWHTDDVHGKWAVHSSNAVATNHATLANPSNCSFPSSRHGIGVWDGRLRHEQHRSGSIPVHAWCSLSLLNDPRHATTGSWNAWQKHHANVWTSRPSNTSISI